MSDVSKHLFDKELLIARLRRGTPPAPHPLAHGNFRTTLAERRKYDTTNAATMRPDNDRTVQLQRSPIPNSAPVEFETPPACIRAPIHHDTVPSTAIPFLPRKGHGAFCTTGWKVWPRLLCQPSLRESGENRSIPLTRATERRSRQPLHKRR